MGTLISRISSLNKRKRLSATVVEYFGGLVSVKVGGGSVIRNLKLIGGPVKAGDNVFVDYTAGTPPVVLSNGVTPPPAPPAPTPKKKYADKNFVPPVVPANAESIQLFSPGVDVVVFPCTSDGLIAALAASHSGDGVSIPMCTIAGGPWTIPDGVEVFGNGYNSFLDGSVGAASGSNGYLSNIRVTTLLESGVFDYLYQTSGVLDSSNNGQAMFTLTSQLYSQINPHNLDTRFVYETVAPGPYTNSNGDTSYQLAVWIRSHDVPAFVFDASGHNNNSNILSYSVENVNYARIIASPNWGSVFWLAAGSLYTLVSGSLGWKFSVIKAVYNGIINTNGVIVSNQNYANPVGSDRAVWDDVGYPAKHAQDLANGTFTCHLPTPTGNSADAGKAVVLNSTGTAWIIGS